MRLKCCHTFAIYCFSNNVLGPFSSGLSVQFCSVQFCSVRLELVSLCFRSMHIRKQALGIKTFESGVKIVGNSNGNAAAAAQQTGKSQTTAGAYIEAWKKLTNNCVSHMTVEG